MKGLGWCSGAQSPHPDYQKILLRNPEQTPPCLCAVVPLPHSEKHLWYLPSQ